MDAHQTLIRLIEAQENHDKARRAYLRLDFRRQSDKVQARMVMDAAANACIEYNHALRAAKVYVAAAKLREEKAS